MVQDKHFNINETKKYMSLVYKDHKIDLLYFYIHRKRLSFNKEQNDLLHRNTRQKINNHNGLN